MTLQVCMLTLPFLKPYRPPWSCISASVEMDNRYGLIIVSLTMIEHRPLDKLLKKTVPSPIVQGYTRNDKRRAHVLPAFMDYCRTFALKLWPVTPTNKHNLSPNSIHSDDLLATVRDVKKHGCIYCCPISRSLRPILSLQAHILMP